MLDSLRATKGGILTWIFLGAIIVVFIISFGPGSLTKGSAGCGAPPVYAARVNGETVGAGEFATRVDQMKRFRAQFGQDVRDPAELAALQREAMDGVVEDALVVQEARRRGIVVTDADVADQIGSIEGLTQNGIFQLDTYKAWATRQYGSPAKFEDTLRDDLLRRRLYAVVDETAKVSDAEVKQSWKASADRVELTVVRFPLAAAEKEAKPSDADVKAFADKEGARIQKFYDDNKARFDQQRRVRARHILARVAPGQDDAAAKDRVEKALARVKGGEDFAKVATDVSDDVNTKGRGGDLGLVADGVPDADFSKAVLPLEKGQLSEPFRTAAGWHVARVEEVLPAKKETLDDARLEIARELLAKDRGTTLARQRAEAALAAAKGGKALAAQFPAATPDGKVKPVTLGGEPVVAEETGPLTGASPFVPHVGAVPELVQAALAADSGAVIPKVFDTPAGPVVAAVKLREKPDEAKFAAERTQVETMLRRQKQAAVRYAWLEELKKGARIEENQAYLQAAPQ
jgi:peptidyl-prolyl cis-trans isomerase D